MLHNNERYIFPQVAMKTGFMSLQSGKRFIVNKDEVMNLYNDYARIIERLT